MTAEVIHAAIYKSRPDVKAVVHLHTPATVAVSCLKHGFQCIAQKSAYFHKRVAYHDWGGISDDVSEGPRLEKAAQSSPDAASTPNVLVMRIHGFCTFGLTSWTLAQLRVACTCVECVCVCVRECMHAGVLAYTQS